MTSEVIDFAFKSDIVKASINLKRVLPSQRPTVRVQTLISASVSLTVLNESLVGQSSVIENKSFYSIAQ